MAVILFKIYEIWRLWCSTFWLQVPLEGFDRRCLDAKLSIAITANFVNGGTREEAEVRQISGIGKQYNLDFFKVTLAEIHQVFFQLFW